MIPTIVKSSVALAEQLAVAAIRGGVGIATSLVRRVVPGRADGETTTTAREAAPVVDITPPKPDVSADPITQPPAPEHAPTPGATTTIADPAPATGNPATRPTAKRATARKGPATKAPAKKAPASATAAQKAVAKKTPAKKVAPTKPASTLDEPAAPVDDDPIVYSSGPDA